MRKLLFWLCLVGLVATGCATSTVQTRRDERLIDYNALSPEHKVAVESGQIKVGMSTEAVYIAWGKPSQVLAGESSRSPAVTWLYYGSYLEQYPYWNYDAYYYGHGSYSSPRLAYEYFPRSYVRAYVVFEDNTVREWRSLVNPKD
jgi:hypothetical protein